LPVSNISSAALYRAIEKWHPTLLIDEGDTFVVRDDDELRGILNSGHTRDLAFVVQLVGEDLEPRKFSTWAPKAIAAIGSLASTLLDRSIIVRMRRRRRDEEIERLAKSDTVEFDAADAVCWAADHHAHCAALTEIPAELHDRAADSWSTLFAIATGRRQLAEACTQRRDIDLPRQG
jgi:hypothetical protein